MSEKTQVVYEWALRDFANSRSEAVNGISDALALIEDMDEEKDRQHVLNCVMMRLEKALKASDEYLASVILRTGGL